MGKKLETGSIVAWSGISEDCKELVYGRVAGHFEELPFVNFCLTQLGVFPKKEHNSFCLIHHLSFPFGSSLNDSINKDLAPVCYSTF